MNGYLAAVLGGQAQSNDVAPAAQTKESVTILFGSQTGTAEMLAGSCAAKAKEKGLNGAVLSMADASIDTLRQSSRVLLLTSTYGDGEFPDNAQPLWDALTASRPSLSGVKYSVLALGDKNYPQFCEAGKKLDLIFEELGAARVYPRIDCDTDYEIPFAAWMENALNALNGSVADSPAAAPAGTPSMPAEEIGWSKKRPFPARLAVNQLLTSVGSDKEVRHFEIDIEGSELKYQAGDALGVQPINCPEIVHEILSSAGLDGEEAVNIEGVGETSLRQALGRYYDLTPLVEELPKEGIGASELVTGLRKLQPRLYSISSSPASHGNLVHLTVGIVRYEKNGRPRKGVCSTFLAERASESVPVFFHSSPSFRLPSNPVTPVIMVGPGTGVAPFRGFLYERRATGATGKNWLFFGDQKAEGNFYYRDELQGFLADGTLTRLDTAFSRDQAEKIYVQHRMLENAAELWAWLDEGAYFYVCGDASRMAKDVDGALHEVVVTGGGKTSEQAIEYVRQMKQQKRYLRDVY